MRRTYVQINGVLYEKGTEPVMEQRGPDIMPDIKPYRSMVTGEIISSRSRHRQHLRDHGMVEVGNDSILTRPYQGIPDADPRARREALRHQVTRFTDREWRQMGERHRRAVIRHMENGGKD